MATVSVFGGTGFLGRCLVRRLAHEGTSVRVAVRHADRARRTAHEAGLDRVQVVGADVRDLATIAPALAGADAVVDAVSAYVETGGVTFESVHVRGAETLARQAAAAGVARFVLVSGIGADPESGGQHPVEPALGADRTVRRAIVGLLRKARPGVEVRGTLLGIQMAVILRQRCR